MENNSFAIWVLPLGLVIRTLTGPSGVDGSTIKKFLTPEYPGCEVLFSTTSGGEYAVIVGIGAFVAGDRNST